MAVEDHRGAARGCCTGTRTVTMAKTRAQTKDAPRSNGLTIAIAAIVAIAVWLALHAEPWQSWSHDGFWKMDRALADPGPLYSGKEFDVYTTSATECIPGRCTTY